MEQEIENKPKRGRKKTTKNNLAPSTPLELSLTVTLRDQDGLLKGVEYKKTPLGFIDWRAMVNDEHVVLNKMTYAKEGVDLSALNEEDINKLKLEATENKKLIKLGGFKELSRLRGIKSQKFQLVNRTDNMASVTCCIEFIPNYENPQGLTVEALALASTENVTGEYAKYLEVIASNRAFVRCIKEALNILTLAEEEIKIDEDVKVAQVKPGSPLHLMQTTCLAHDLNFDDVIKIALETGIEVKPEWVSLESLPVSVIATLIPKIKKYTKQNKKDE